MSVIWSGITEEGAVVPVQVTAEGKVVAVGDGPEGDYLKLTGGNLTGDLTVNTDKIALKTDGNITAAGGNYYLNKVAAGANVVVRNDSTNDPVIEVCKGGLQAANRTAQIKSDGSITAARALDVRDYTGATGGVRLDGDGVFYLRANDIYDPSTIVFGIYSGGSSSADRALGIRKNGSINIGGLPAAPNITLNADGSITAADGACGFTADGELIFTSRNTRYKMAVSNGMCVAEEFTRQMELKERADKFVGNKIEPKGEVTTDNDNA